MTVNSDADGVTLIEFSKYKVKNYKTDKIDLFDVTTEGFLNFPPDFDEGTPLFHEYYCTCLLRKVSTYHFSQFLPFLDHQYKSLKHPHKWLRSFDSLLQINKTYFLSISSKEKYKELRRCIKDRLTLMNNMVREERPRYGANVEDRARFNMKKIKENLKSVRGFENKKNILLRWKADYLQDVEDNLKASFIRKIDIELEFLNATKDSIEQEPTVEKIIFFDSAAQLGYIIGQLLSMENKNGLLFKASLSAIVKLICSMFMDKDGKPFLESTMLRNLRDFNSGALSKKNKIELEIDLDNFKTETEET